MADFDASEDLHFIPQTKLEAGSRGRFLCPSSVPRFFGIALFVAVCLLFPSDPPEFISHTIFAKCWEIVHLLIIGVFVSYGLFGRRRAQSQMRNHTPPALHTHNIAHASAMFNFEHQNPCYDNIGRNQAWEFAPFGLEPTVVVRPGSCDFDYEPLDLPVRRLRSKVESDSEEEFANDSEFEADRSGCCYSEEDNESENLEGNSSPVPWNWSNPAEELRFGVDCEADQQPSLSDQSSASPESRTLGTQNSWVKPEQRPPLATPDPSSMVATLPKEEAEALRLPSPSKGSSPSEEQPPLESRTDSVDAFSYAGTQEPELHHSKSYREPVENLSGNQAETMFFPSLKSKSMRMGFKEEAIDVSSFLGNEDYKLHRPESFGSPMEVRDSGEDVETMFFPPNSSSSSVGTQDPGLHCSKSYREPVENLSGFQAETMFFPSLKSKSMRMSFKEEAIDVSSFLGNKDSKLHCPKTSRSPVEVRDSGEDVETKFFPPYSSSSSVGTQDPGLHCSKSYREPVENLSGFQAETMFFPSPLKSKSMRMGFKEEAIDVSSFLGNEDSKLHRPKPSRSPVEVRDSEKDVEAKFFPPYSSSSSVGTQDPGLRRSKSSRPPKLGSPVSNFMPPLSDEPSPLCSAVPESPTIVAENKQRESKKPGSSVKESSENQIPSPLVQKSGSIAKRGGSRSRRCRKREDFSIDMQDSAKSRKDSSRNECSSDQPVFSNLTSLSASSHDLASAAEPKSRRYTDGFSHDDENMHGSPARLTVKQHINDNVVSEEACKTEIQELESDNIPYKATSPLDPPRNDPVASMESNSDPGNKGGQLLTPVEDGRKTLSRTSHSRRFSCSAFFDRELWKGSKDETKEVTKKGKDDGAASNSGKCGWDCLKLDVKPTLTKGALTGKSVRTVKPRAITSEPSHTSENTDKQKGRQNVAEKTRERQDVVIISIGISSKNGRQPNDTSQKGKKHEGVGRTSLQLDKERSHGEMSVPESVNEDEDYTSEIDRKADEFIAKFKQQIRLQKLASTSNRHQTLC